MLDNDAKKYEKERKLEIAKKIFDINFNDTINKYPYINLVEMLIAENRLYHKEMKQYIINGLLLLYNDSKDLFLNSNSSAFINMEGSIETELENGKFKIFNYKNKYDIYTLTDTYNNLNKIITEMDFKLLDEDYVLVVEGEIWIIGKNSSPVNSSIHVKFNDVDINDNIIDEGMYDVDILFNRLNKIMRDNEDIDKFIQEIQSKNELLYEYIDKFSHIFGYQTNLGELNVIRR